MPETNPANVASAFDSLVDQETVVVRDPIGLAMRAWATDYPAEWARIVYGYVAGTCAMKLAQVLMAKAATAAEQLVRQQGNEGIALGADYRTIANASPAVVGLNIHLLIHVIPMDMSLLEAVAPECDPLQKRIFG